MPNQDHTSLDTETRDAFIQAFIGDTPVEPASDEDLAVVAERGLDSFHPEQRERLLKAMITNTDGAAGTVDVYRLLRDTSNEVNSDQPPAKRFDFVSSSMAGAWAVAACLALFLSVGSFNTPTQPSPIDWPSGNDLGISNQEGISGPSLQDLLNEIGIEPTPEAIDEKNAGSEIGANKSRKFWLTGSVLMMTLIPPIFWLYRKKQK